MEGLRWWLPESATTMTLTLNIEAARHPDPSKRVRGEVMSAEARDIPTIHGVQSAERLPDRLTSARFTCRSAICSARSSTTKACSAWTCSTGV